MSAVRTIPPRRDLVDRRDVIAAALLLGALPVLAGSALAAEAAGRVDAAKGRSTGLLAGSVRDLQAQSDVFLQELVQTYAGARLQIALGADTRVNLGERTRLKIEQSVVDRGGVLLLERGALLFDRPDKSAGGEPVVLTPFAIIAARGTRFFVGPSNEVIGVFVERGSVSVRNNAGRVVLEAGEGTNLTSPDVAPTPPAKWGAPRIQAAMRSVT